MSLHGIKAITLQTGLSSHVIRVWEKRYNAVVPQRTETNRRRYTDEDLHKLTILSKLTQQGYSISQIANLPIDELESLLTNSSQAIPFPNQPDLPESDEQTINAALHTIEQYDQSALYEIFEAFNKEQGYSALIEKLIVPLMYQVGAAWHSGDMSTAEEHAATSFIKDYLSQVGHSYTEPGYAPTLLVTTPAGQLHEIGAVIATSLARKAGWKVVYLGPSLPAKEIAGAAEKMQARAVLLSLVYPTDDPRIDSELNDLRNNLGSDYPIIIGGSAVGSYQESLQKIKAHTVSSMSDLNDHLLRLRATPNG